MLDYTIMDMLHRIFDKELELESGMGSEGFTC